MGVQICHCNKENQNIPTSCTDYAVIDEKNNRNKNKHSYKYYLNKKKISQNIKNNFSSSENKDKNINIIIVNKDLSNSKYQSSSFSNNLNTNKILDYNKANKEIEIINNFDKKIKQYAEYISEDKYKEIDNNPIIQKIENNLDNNYNYSNNSQEKSFKRPALLFKRDKSIYKGSWNYSFQKEGFGIYIDSQGNKYIGNWKNDVFNGKGSLLSINGDYYNGDFISGKIEGNGLYHSSKDKYDYLGEFKNNKFNGKGKLIYEDNNIIYEGYFKEGFMEGEGNILFSDGSYYQGNFEKNCFNGKGKFFFKNGKEYNGTWENNAMNGLGVFTWDDGTKYKGEYKNNLREGNGVYSFCANLYDGFWVNGLPHGEGILLNEGLRIVGKFRYGKIVEIKETKGANRDIFLRFSIIKPDELSEQKNNWRNSLPKYNTNLLPQKNFIDKQYKSTKDNRIRIHSKSKDNKDKNEKKKKPKSKSKEKKKKNSKK